MYIKFMDSSFDNLLPCSNNCFIMGSRVLLDQGDIPIEMIYPLHYTIGDKKIVALTKMRSTDKVLICFQKNALGLHYPKKKTIMSQNHLIEYKGAMFPAHSFVGKYGDNVTKIQYKDEVMYNVLLEEYGKMNVNGLIVETLHPDSSVAKAYIQRMNNAKSIP